MTKRAAWNSRSPSQFSASIPGAGGLHSDEVGYQPFVDERFIAGRENGRLVCVDEPVVLGMEDRVDGGQADVFVAAAITGDEMRVEHFVVVGRRIMVVPDAGIRIGGLRM